MAQKEEENKDAPPGGANEFRRFLRRACVRSNLAESLRAMSWA